MLYIMHPQCRAAVVLAALAAGVALLPAAALAQTEPVVRPTTAESTGRGHLAVHGGVFDITDNNDLLAGLEYRFEDLGYGIAPFIGAASVQVTEGIYAYGGLLWDISSDRLPMYVQPSFAVVAYTDFNNGADLGGPINFRSALEVGYRTIDNWRYGLNFSHISNAGLYSDNPGTETLTFVVAVPLADAF